MFDWNDAFKKRGSKISHQKKSNLLDKFDSLK